MESILIRNTPKMWKRIEKNYSQLSKQPETQPNTKECVEWMVTQSSYKGNDIVLRTYTNSLRK